MIPELKTFDFKPNFPKQGSFFPDSFITSKSEEVSRDIKLIMIPRLALQTLPEVVSEAGYAVAGVAGVGVDEGHDGQDPSELGGRLGVLDQVQDVLGEGVEEGVQLLGVQLP